ncbi:MAG: hypothetical protein CHACPFDD_00829 [Phycisphaerae bacterium]|nr:hypothetical protein [Phycisphaerae bacterium]
MQELIEQARKLGVAIAQHPRTLAYFSAAQAVRDDLSARQLLSEYESHAGRVGRAEAEHQPIEPADKRHLAELQSKVAGHEGIKQMMRAQTDYIDLMQRVNRAMEEQIVAAQAKPA